MVSSEAPILLLDGELAVIAMSESFARTFQVDQVTAVGASLFLIGAGEWDVPQLRSLLKATLSGIPDIPPYEMDLNRAGATPRRLVMTARLLIHDEPWSIRLLLSVVDVTDARLADQLKDDLLREKAMLFQELQHRVANSLQIIASVLMQNARRVPEETRGYLVDAHSRVMSIAALQQQLVASSASEVDLRGYFTELCDSIAASMIPDRAQLSLTVEADKSNASADVSVSLGLIVTELVINALKHAFPDGRSGHIVVSYETAGLGWKLSVRDDGAGMPDKSGPSTGGLGTSIVQALARHLGAKVEVADNHPGTIVSLVHSA